MKNCMKIVLGAASVLTAGQAVADFMITGYLDGVTAAVGVTSRVMEFYALVDIPDLNAYTIQRSSNGGSWSNAVTTWNDFTGPVSAGTFFYLVDDADAKTDLEGLFGAGSLDPAELNGGLSGNGNDAFRILRESDSAILDTMGDPADVLNPNWAAGYAWEHEDGWLYRNNGTGPNGDTFVLANWIVQSDGPDADFPVGTFVPSAFDPADLDTDGDVDDADFGIAFAAFTGPNNGPSSNPAADLDNDGDVDDADFGLAFAAFTGPGGGAAVPEPASLMLLGACAVLAVRRRRN